MVSQGEWHRKADLFERYAYLSFNCLYGDIQEFRYFTVFKVALFYQQKDEFAFGGQPVDGPINVLDHFRGDEDLLGAGLPRYRKILEIVFQYFKGWFPGPQEFQRPVPGTFQEV